MRAVAFTVLALIAMVAGMNTFGRAAINDHAARVAAERHAVAQAEQHAHDVAACAAGRTTAIMVDGKFCQQ